MSEFFKAELKDRFLRYATERDDYFEVQLLYDEFLRPSYNITYVERLVQEIIDHDPRLLDTMSGNGTRIFMVSSTPFTLDFLDEEGGFTDLYIKEEEKWDTFMYQLTTNRTLSAGEKSKLGIKDKRRYKRERTFLFALIAAVVVSFFISTIMLLKSVFFTPDYVEKAELERTFEKERDLMTRRDNAVKHQINLVLLELEQMKRDTIKLKSVQ